MDSTLHTSCFIVILLMIGVHAEIATFNMAGVTGNITFTAMDQGGYSIVVNLIGLQRGVNYNWAIHQLPMFYNKKMPCLSLGDALYNFSAEFDTPLRYEAMPFINETTLGDMIVDRSIILSRAESDEIICAHIHRDRDDTITAVATFQTPFSGTIMLRQDANNSKASTTIFVDLYDNVAPIESANYSWRVVDISGSMDSNLSPDMICEQVKSKEPFNPNNVIASSCNQSNLATCAVGDMTGKFSTLTVHPVGSHEKYFFNDPNIALSGSSSVMNLVIMLEDVTGVQSCGYIKELAAKEVRAEINSHGVRGTFTFRQTSALAYTTFEIDVHNMRNLGGGYHIHLFPVPQRITADDELCSDASVSGHYNPYGVVKGDSYLGPLNTTQDRYEVGDLSGKYGTLNNLNSMTTTGIDWNLSLFGTNSIIGRSIVIHRSSGPRWVCATIGYPGKIKTVYGKFQTPVVGSIMFRQLADDPLSDTSIHIDVTYDDGSPATFNHKWHIHTSKVGKDLMHETGVCKSCKGHSNPFMVYTEDYTGCGKDFPGRCELGDLTGKHDTITIAKFMNTKEGTFFATDVQLPLSGYGTIEAMSVVIHDKNATAPRMACTNLYTLEPKVLTTGKWTESHATCHVTFTQKSYYDPTQVEISMQNLGQNAGGYHVHMLPVPMGAEMPCSAESVQGHFNPFHAGKPPNATDDMYEIGDLSSKLGSLQGQDNVTNTFQDANLPLSGAQSIAGRCIVIHNDDEVASRWMCSSLQQQLPVGAIEVEAEAMVNAPGYSGYIKMKQVHYSSGLLDDTTIELSLSPKDGYDNLEVSWRVTRAASGCSGDLDTYNPYGVNVSKVIYDEQCGISSQLRCQIGDLLGKHGKFDTALDRAIFNDINLPLSGRASVIGHNFYLTVAGNESAIDVESCSMLKPSASTGMEMSLTFPELSTKFDAYDFRETISNNVSSIEMWQVVATQEPVLSSTKCSTITFWILGDNLDEISEDIVEASKNDLGNYTCKSDCSPEICIGSRTLPSLLIPVLLTVIYLTIR